MTPRERQAMKERKRVSRGRAYVQRLASPIRVEVSPQDDIWRRSHCKRDGPRWVRKR